MKVIPIVFAFDNNMEMPAGVCMTSLLENAESDTFYDIFILHPPHCDFSASLFHDLPKVYGNCKLTFRKVEHAFVGAYQVRGITEATYYRLIAPKLIPEYGKFLYSDVDVIFREDLGKYYSIDLKDNYFGAVDTGIVSMPDMDEYDYRNGYYYAGNLVVNATKLLEDGKIEEFRELGKNNYDQQDMMIMNLACKGRIAPMTPAYCLTTVLYSFIVNRRKDMEDIYGVQEIEHTLKYGIVHYDGAKPWNQPCPNMDIWWHYYRKSIFYDEKFTHDFWIGQRDNLKNMSLKSRIKQLLRFPLDRN
jgi:lipopolysaccharide biosynthesis glycosyltransferase